MIETICTKCSNYVSTELYGHYCNEDVWYGCPVEHLMSDTAEKDIEKNDYCNSEKLSCCWDCKYVAIYERVANKCTKFKLMEQ